MRVTFYHQTMKSQETFRLGDRALENHRPGKTNFQKGHFSKHILAARSRQSVGEIPSRSGNQDGIVLSRQA